MNIRLQIILVTGISTFAGILTHYLVQRKLHLKYCLVWILATIIMFISALFPGIIKWITELVGIKTPSNFIFMIYGLFMLLIIFTLTAIISHMNVRIFRLVQYQAMLEERLRKIEQLQEKISSLDFSISKENTYGQDI